MKIDNVIPDKQEMKHEFINQDPLEELISTQKLLF